MNRLFHRLPKHSHEPENKKQFTESFDSFYTRFAGVYDIVVKLFPFWRRWLRQAMPLIQGPRVLEVSFGTGYLMTQYASEFDAFGIDYNVAMLATAWKNLRQAGVVAHLQRANVEALPYKDGSFDSVLNTMSFTAYPDSEKAMSEMHRVLKEGGRLILIDVNYPTDGNFLGTMVTNAWRRAGDIIRDMGALFHEFDFEYTDQEIGGCGSVHLYIAMKRS